MTVSVTDSDDRLALRAHEGDRDAFGGLYERYLPGVYDFIARMTGNRDLAEDVVQSAFANAWRDLQRRRVTGNIKAWLYTIARNEALNQIRHKKRVVSGGDDLDGLGKASPFTNLSPSRLTDPEAALVDQELIDLVWQSAAALSAKEYSLLDMHLRRGLTADELAASLGVRRGNVYVMLSRLRDSLEESVTAALLMRRGRDDCTQLDAILSRHSASGLNRELRRAIQAHLQDCSVCQESKRRYVAPAEIFAGLAFIPVPISSQAVPWAVISGAGTAGGAVADIVARTGQQVVRWWRGLGMAAQAAIVGSVATVVVGLAVGIALVMALSDSGASGVEDPSDVRSTSHEIGQPSDQSIISISWSRQPDADGYSIEWSRGSEALPDAVADLPGDASGTASPVLTEGSWFFNLRTLGRGVWTSTVHLGPFVIKGEDNASDATGSSDGDDNPAPAGNSTAPTPSPAATAVAGAVSGPSSSGSAAESAGVPSPSGDATPATPPPANPAPAATPKPPSTESPKPAPTPSPTPPADDAGDDGDDNDGDNGSDSDGHPDDHDRGKDDCKRKRWHDSCRHDREKCHPDGRFRPSHCCPSDKLLHGVHKERLRCKVFRP
jgi:RNA polymerase sigma factor (sigma-70 family)